MRLSRVAVIITLALGVLLVPLAAAGQPREKVPRVGALEPGRAGGGCIAGFRQGLRDLGYIEGRTITIDYRYADENPGRISILAAELVRQTPDLLWTHSPQGARAARQASTTIPIVSGVAGDLVEQGLAASLARPGGNVTGFELGDIELAGKRLQLLKEAVPTVARVAVLVDPTARNYDGVPKNIEREARRLGVHLQRVEADSPEAFEGAFAAMVRERADALMIVDLPLFVRNSPRLMELALRHRLPTISGWRRYAEAGSLISYGANVPDVCRRSAVYVDKILKGAKPDDLPVQRPDKFELIINRKTAKALGVTIPSSNLLAADELIQ
jgi:putative ABC transport system substrate-binding protein